MKRAPKKKSTRAEGTCPECGYRAMVIGATCPMCLPCARCGRKLMRCVCIEGE